MLFRSIALCALLAPTPAPQSPETPKAGVATHEGHGKLPWFAGTFDEALAKAKASNQLVFIDFWTEWCVWCKRLDAGAFSDDSVVAAMKDVLCVSIDAESKTGTPLAQKFKVRGYPTLLVLSPDGSLRDHIGGFLTPEQFKIEMQRMRDDKGTLSDLRRRVSQDPKNVDLAYELMQKLESLGDDDGALEQRNAIPKLDPEGKSLAMHMFAFEKLLGEIQEGWNASQTLDVAKMTAFVEKETYPKVLFNAWFSVHKMHEYLAQDASQKGQTDEAKKHADASFQALQNIWKNAGKDERTNLGPQVALDFFQRRASLSADEKAFALQVAKDTQVVAPDNAAAVAGLACCLYMNGSKAEAITHIQRAIELDPANKNWPQRLAEFQADG